MKVTTLISTLNPAALGKQLASLRGQSERPSRVVVADMSLEQSAGSVFSAAAIAAAFSDLSIELLPSTHIPTASVVDRCRPLLEHFSARRSDQTELIHLLIDDSTLDPMFYEQHFVAHRTGVIRCAVSQAWIATDATGSGVAVTPPPAIFDPDYLFLALSSSTAFALTLGPPRPSNWLGTLSNATFRAEVALLLAEPSLEGISFSGQESLGAFLKASSDAPLGFIRMHLGQADPDSPHKNLESGHQNLAEARLAYFALAIAGRRLGHLSAEQCGLMFANWGTFVHQRHSADVNVAELCALLPSLAGGERNAEARFVRLWNEYDRARHHPAQ